MEILIDIDEDLYKAVINGLNPKEIWYLRSAIKNGILLPKGHGRIVDVSKMEYMKTLNEVVHNGLSWKEAIRRIKNSAPTIVEADN